MKELSIEEKAKRYDEAIERAESIYNETAIPSATTKGICTYIFPELKESEYDRMVKFIKNQLFNIKKTITENYELDAKLTKAICWLEKQCEQKLYVNDNAKEMFIKALERAEEQNNKGYKLTYCDKNSWWEDFKAYTSCIIEQKPASWSKEDEKQARQIERIVHDDGCTQKLQKQIADWFESLKARYTWKPSDEQMRTLEHYMHTLVCTKYKEILFGLYSDLKELRGE